MRRFFVPEHWDRRVIRAKLRRRMIDSGFEPTLQRYSQHSSRRARKALASDRSAVQVLRSHLGGNRATFRVPLVTTECCSEAAQSRRDAELQDFWENFWCRPQPKLALSISIYIYMYIYIYIHTYKL